MSDYISKSKAVETLKKYKFGAIGNEQEREYTKEMVLVILNGLPTLDEKEIIRKAFERVVERLEGKKWGTSEWRDKWRDEIIGECIAVVKEEGAENECN